MERGLHHLESIARRRNAYIDGFIARAKFPLNTNILRGVNNKLKVIKRIRHGFRELA